MLAFKKNTKTYDNLRRKLQNLNQSEENQIFITKSFFETYLKTTKTSRHDDLRVNFMKHFLYQRDFKFQTIMNVFLNHFGQSQQNNTQTRSKKFLYMIKGGVEEQEITVKLPDFKKQYDQCKTLVKQ